MCTGLVNSMTGFGYSRTKAEDYSINVEIKAVNHRFLDVNIKLHSKYAQLEERIRRLIKQSCHRGRIDVSVFIQKTENLTPQVKINARGLLLSRKITSAKGLSLEKN